LILEIVHPDGSIVPLKTGAHFRVDDENSLKKALLKFLYTSPDISY
jgi:hypothetical protein